MKNQTHPTPPLDVSRQKPGNSAPYLARFAGVVAITSATPGLGHRFTDTLHIPRDGEKYRAASENDDFLALEGALFDS
jgi:hypothetical protein